MPKPTNALIVDDEAHAIVCLKTLLHALGVTEIWEAATCAEALAAYQAHKPQVVLCDLSLPVVSGGSVVDSLFAVDPLAAVIVVTAQANMRVVEKMHEMGVIAYLLKQTPRDQMLKLLGDALDAAGEPVEDDAADDGRA